MPKLTDHELIEAWKQSSLDHYVDQDREFFDKRATQNNKEIVARRWLKNTLHAHTSSYLKDIFSNPEIKFDDMIKKINSYFNK